MLFMMLSSHLCYSSFVLIAACLDTVEEEIFDDFLNKKYRSVLPTGVIREMCLLLFTSV